MSGEISMILRKYGTLFMIVSMSLIGLLAGCGKRRTNSQFIVRISGSARGIEFEGQCTAQKSGLLASGSNAESLDVNGTVISVSQPQEYETTGFFIYCSIANQSAKGTLTVQLLQEGIVVASAKSVSPEIPAAVEYGEKP
jgi:hypothetical protein